MSLFIDEVVEENAKLKEENKHLIEKYEILEEEWSKLLDDKISYSHLLQKYKKAIKILEDKLEIHIDYDNFFREEKPYIIVSYREDEVLTKEEYKLLKEVLSDE